jgi:hypothetical protein
LQERDGARVLLLRSLERGDVDVDGHCGLDYLSRAAGYRRRLVEQSISLNGVTARCRLVSSGRLL